MKIEITEEMKSLKGNEFVLYCLTKHPDIDFRKKIDMLIYAVSGNLDKAEKYINRLIKEKDKELIAYYRFKTDNDKIKGKERVGTILDGCLYFG